MTRADYRASSINISVVPGKELPMDETRQDSKTPEPLTVRPYAKLRGYVTTFLNAEELAQFDIALENFSREQPPAPLVARSPERPESEKQRLFAKAWQELREARETIKRLNRRCQLAEAAVEAKVEEFEKRSQKALRAYYFDMGKRAGTEAQHAALEQLHALVNEWVKHAEKARGDNWNNTDDAKIWQAIHRERAWVFDRCASQLQAVLLQRDQEPTP